MSVKKADKELKYFNFLASEIDSLYHEAALKFGLSDSELLVMYAVCNYGGGCFLNDICRLSGTSKQTVNSGVRKLEGEGIVFLEAFDGRRKIVRLTEKGRELAGRTAARVIGIENEIWDSWTEEEREIYLKLTQKYLDAFREKISKLPAEGRMKN